MQLEAILESLLFVMGDEGLTLKEIMDILQINEQELNNLIEILKQNYLSEQRGIEIVFLGNRVKLATKRKFKPYIEKLLTISDDGTLSASALETLAIIAYNQPVTRVMVDEIRGISSSHMIKKLVYKNLICEVGRSEQAGRPILYGTTPLFLDYFGLNDLSDLPNIEKPQEDIVKDLYESKYKDDV